MQTMFAVMWYCNNPTIYGVFEREADAIEYRDAIKRELDALFKRIGARGDERVEVLAVRVNPSLSEVLTPRYGGAQESLDAR